MSQIPTARVVNPFSPGEYLTVNACDVVSCGYRLWRDPDASHEADDALSDLEPLVSMAPEDIAPASRKRTQRSKR